MLTSRKINRQTMTFNQNIFLYNVINAKVENKVLFLLYQFYYIAKHRVQIRVI